MTTTQIKQTIGQLEASIDKVEAFLCADDYRLYCDNVYSAITIWKGVLKEIKEKDESE